MTLHTPRSKSNPALDLDRSLVLNRVMNSTTLPTPPAVAMQIVQKTSRSDVTVSEIAELLRQDPSICAQVLKAINSCLYSLPEPITSIDRAVLLLGLNTIRSIVLALSLPAMQFTAIPDKVYRYFWQSSVSGAVIARELSLRMKIPSAEDDLLCGLLRDLGLLLLHQAFPEEMIEFTRGMADRPFSSLTEYEREVFGVDHAEVSAELLRRWNLPDSFVTPIRYHHRPERLAGERLDILERCERLSFVDVLTNLDVVSLHPGELDALLARAKQGYGFSQTELVEFLQLVVPKVQAFTALFNIEIGQCPDFATTLTGGCQELLKLTAASGCIGVAATVRLPPQRIMTNLSETGPDTPSPVSPSRNTQVANQPLGLPEFSPEFLNEFPPGGCVLNGYELRREIGRGAMGVVFEGYETTLDRLVAIKMISPEMKCDPQCTQRFIREARSAAAIRHENVVAIYTVKESPAVTYLSMEFVEGESLETLVERDHPLPIGTVRDLASQITAGLCAAHAKKVVHRDVKPANILIEKSTGRVKLTDFGLARSENDVRLTLDGTLIGTPLYMSPEQACGKELDHQTDLFSLGSVLYTAATGRAAFDSQSVYDVIKRVCEANPIPPSKIRPDLPEWFDQLVLKLLSKNKVHRYASADEVLTFLHSVERDEAKPRGGWRRLFGMR